VGHGGVGHSVADKEGNDGSTKNDYTEEMTRGRLLEKRYRGVGSSTGRRCGFGKW